MSNAISWLPPIISLSEYGGDWDIFLDAIYSYFKKDFINSQPKFRGQTVGLKKLKCFRGKDTTFWHITSECEKDNDRLPDLRRCERIRWPRPMIENSLDSYIKCWPEKVNYEERFHLWLYQEDYVVVISKRKGYFILCTAFYIEYNHTKQKLEQRYKKHHK